MKLGYSRHSIRSRLQVKLCPYKNSVNLSCLIAIWVLSRGLFPSDISVVTWKEPKIQTKLVYSHHSLQLRLHVEPPMSHGKSKLELYNCCTGA